MDYGNVAHGKLVYNGCVYEMWWDKNHLTIKL